MAIFSNIETVKQQLISKKFDIALKYLHSAYRLNTKENKRLYALDVGAFRKVELDDNNFALEQVYYTKDRKDCFFESHREYIDVQFILEGEEYIEVANIYNLIIESQYDKNIDLIKYKETNDSSILKLKKGDIAVFFPEDAHMPCIKVDNKVKVVKTVVKVKI